MKQRRLQQHVFGHDHALTGKKKSKNKAGFWCGPNTLRVHLLCMWKLTGSSVVQLWRKERFPFRMVSIQFSPTQLDLCSLQYTLA